MNNTLHTPSPWQVDDGIITPEIMINSIKCNASWIAVGIADEEGYAESVAYCHPVNAHLISAAPDLLSALIELERVESSPHSETVRYLARENAREAIRKAKGEA